MKNDDVMKMISGCGVLVFIMLLGCGIAIGIAAHSFWVGLGVVFCLWISVAAAFYYVMEDDFRTYLWTVGCFAGLLGLFANYGGFGRGWWIAAWLLMAFAHGVVGIYAREQKRVFHSIVANSLATLSIIAGVVEPATIAKFLGPRVEPTPLTPLSLEMNIIWTWVLLIIGLFFLFAGWEQGYGRTEGKSFIAFTLIGVGLLAGATWLSGLRDGWWWAVPWGIAALMIGHAARELRKYYEPQAANVGVMLVILCLAIGIGGPYLTERGWSLGAHPRTASPPLIGQTTPHPPVGTLSQADMAATQLAQAVQTATAAVQAPSPTPTALAPLATPTLHAQVTGAEPPIAQIKFDGTAGWKAISGFLLAAVRSVWGIFHLIMLILLGYSWFRRGWGGVLLLLALLIGVGVAGGLSSPAYTTLTQVISSSPAGWMRDLLRFSAEKFGHQGWGIVFLGAAVAVILLPALQQTITARHRLKHFPVVKQLFGTTRAYEYVKKSNVSPLLITINSLIFPIIAFGLFIALWVGLRQTAQAGEIPLAAWGIPDLSIPSWKPVWQWQYFALAGLYALAQIILIPLKRKFNVHVSGIAGEVNAWYILIGAFMLALFVPAGVILFLTGQAVAQFLVVPLAGREIRKLQAEEERRRQEEERRRQEEERRRQEEERRQQEEQKREEEKRRKALLWSSPRPLVAMLSLDNAEWFLTDGRVLFIRARGVEQQINLPIQTASALFALKEASPDKEGEVLVIGDKRQLLRIGQNSHDTLQTLTLSQTADAFALNPYKTMLAWVNTSSGTVGGLYLEAGREVIFIKGLKLAPTLAFSHDGRYLALGGSDGTIPLLDIASRQIIKTLTLPKDSPSQGEPMRFLFGRKEGGWLSIYRDRRIALWNTDCQIEKAIRSKRRVQAVDFHRETGRLAMGLSDGVLQVFDSTLNNIFDDTVQQEEEITWVSFSQDGRWVFTIGGKTEVRKVDL